MYLLFPEAQSFTVTKQLKVYRLLVIPQFFGDAALLGKTYKLPFHDLCNMVILQQAVRTKLTMSLRINV